MVNGGSRPRLAACALVVGIAGYQHITSLPAAVRADATDIAAALADPSVGGYSSGTVQLLTDGQATLAGLRAALSDQAKSSSPDDVFLFFFSGHGHRRGHGRSYLLTSDSRLDDLEGTALGDDELLELLSALPSRRQLLVVDSCHSGGVGALKSGASSGAPAGVSQATIDRLAAGRGRVVLASSRDDETSLVLSGERNSVFTGCLLDGLRGEAPSHDGVIRVFDLFDFVSKMVPTKVASQHPVFKADMLEQNFAVALAPAVAPPPDATASTPSPDVNVAKLQSVLATLYPLGPTDSEIWSRAGGDVSRLSLSGAGLPMWHSALRLVARGGGGLDFDDLMRIAIEDYPQSPELHSLRAES